MNMSVKKLKFESDQNDMEFYDFEKLQMTSYFFNSPFSRKLT